jgi:multiple sugar transport system substrate-binding protein
MRRSTRIVPLTLVLAVTLAAGCSGSRPPAQAGAGDPNGTGPLTFVTGRDISGYLQGLLNKWNATHPRERVTLIELPEAADDVRAQMITNLQAKSTRYDVLNLDVIWIAEFAKSGWIVPIDRRQFPLDHLLKPAVDTALFQGRLYAVPYTSNGGLLYYRRDVLQREGRQPPRTWSELGRLASTVAPKYGLLGYAGQFFPYEGLTVNFAEAVQSAGGRILSDDGTRVEVDSPQARRGLDFLVRGVKEGWIPRAALNYKEEESRRAFQEGRLLFLRNWPYMYLQASRPGSKVAGKFGVAPLPGRDGPGSSSLGGADLAISAYSKRQLSALKFIRYFTGIDNQRQVLIQGSQPPVWNELYDDSALIRRFPYLPVLKQSILDAKPRPKSPDYNQVSLAISNAAQEALSLRRSPDATISGLARDLSEIVRND